LSNAAFVLRIKTIADIKKGSIITNNIPKIAKYNNQKSLSIIGSKIINIARVTNISK